MSRENETLEASEALHRRVRAFAAATASEGASAPETFDALACDIARFQAAYVAPVSRLFRARGVDPEKLVTAAQIPAVPTDAFKLARVTAHAAQNDVAVFRTSGTTVGTRGEHAMRTTQTYDDVALRFGRRMLAPDGGRFAVLVLAPPPIEAPDSSLGRMCERFGEAFGGGSAWFLRNGEIALRELMAAIEIARSGGERVMLLGTSFAYVFLLDALARRPLPLPAGSRVMQTGGFKGRSREVSAHELRDALASCFALDPRAIVAEYGMTELSSQAYEGTLRAMHGDAEPAAAGFFRTPPWMRIEPVDGETLLPVAAGDVGIARITDLANVDSSVVVQTMDRVRVDPQLGVALLGRAAGAPPRGCSLAIEELVGAVG